MLLLKRAHVYAPEKIGIKDILIGEEKILAMQDFIDEKAMKKQFPELTVIDVNEKAVVPGIIDPHVHITGGGGEASFCSRIEEIKVETCIESGVTTVIGLLGTDSRTRTVANVVAKARGLTQEGITAYCLTGAYEYPSVSLMDNIADDIVFVPEVLGVKLAISDHRCSTPTVEELIRIGSQARIASLMGGKPGIVHLHTGVGKNGLKYVIEAVENSDIPIAHFVPTHIRIKTPYVDEFVRMGGGIDLTSGEDPTMTIKRLKHFLKVGNTDQITVSSDANGSMPKWNEKREMIGFTAAKLTLLNLLRALVKDGMPLEKALLFMTENTAKRWKIYPKKGCLQVGSDADMLVFDADMNLDAVIARGTVKQSNLKEVNFEKGGFFGILKK